MGKNTGAYLLGVLGAIVSVITVIPALMFLWRMVIRPLLFKPTTKVYKGTETYAIVTGAAGGVGKGFTEKLAKEGFNLIVIDRDEKALNEVAKVIEEKYKVKVVVKVLDLIAMERGDETAWTKFIEEITPLDIGVLVNNVGMCQYLPGNYDTVALKDVRNMITLNISSMLTLTHYVIPLMLKRQQKGLIIGMSSSTSFMPFPMFQIYSSTKAFVRQFHDSINIEYAGKIDAISYAPWYVATEMTKIREKAIYVLSPQEFVEESFKHIGFETHIDPYWFHYLMDFGAWAIPTAIYGKLVAKEQVFVRGRPLKKLEEKQASEKKKE
uniref:Estradiol 17-beta-dehydrogenase, putative n=1 Tax=Entamoeba invadens TaxID=33085 RepID=S0B317_ENTIV|nr:estradiol 17-beta-dehydrogenase, putative [Entamoeba invadens]